MILKPTSITVSADYNDKTYDYTTYWVGRDYENSSEFIALEKLFNFTGKNVIDVGGGFGRLIPILKRHFQKITVFDYSAKLLDEAHKTAENEGIKITTVKGDIYKLSKEVNEKFDCAVMIRVSHHLEDLEKALKEVGLVLNDNGVFILEIANKMHFKAVLTNSLKGNLKFFSQEPISRASKDTAFLNFHPKYIEKMVCGLGFKIEKVLSVSNFRLSFLKRLLPEKVLLVLESLVQKPFAKFYFGPSIIYKLKKTK